MKIKNEINLNEFLDALRKCRGKVELRSADGDVFNLKSFISKYVAIAALLQDESEKLELFCYDKEDEAIMMQFFMDHHDVL